MAENGPILKQMDDPEIVKRLKASDPEGLRALLTVHGPVVQEAVRKRFGSPVAAEAMNFAAMLVWVDTSSKYDATKGKIGAWFMRIAINKAIDIRRGEKRKKFIQLDFDPAYDPSECDETAYREEKAEDAQKRERRKQDMKKIVADLPRVQRIITECDSISKTGEATIDDIRMALRNPTASKGSIYTSRCKARATIRAEMIRLGYYPSDAGRRNNG
jgi:DNA-directed RNA polymerase specialized sigma24 family protein